MFWQVVFDDECTFDDALGPSVGSCKLGQRSPLVQWTSLACIAMAMTVVLCFLHGIDLIRHGLDIFCFIWRDLLHALVLPMDVLSIGHGGLVCGFV